MNLDPVPHPFVNPHVPLPNKLMLYFSGESLCGHPFWAWALMDDTDLYASDRGDVPKKTHRSSMWAATVGLGKGCAFLNEKKWKGDLTIRSHLRQHGIFAMQSTDGLDPMILRCMTLLNGIRCTAEHVDGGKNEFCILLCNQAYQEYCRGQSAKAK